MICDTHSAIAFVLLESALKIGRIFWATSRGVSQRTTRRRISFDYWKPPTSFASSDRPLSLEWPWGKVPQNPHNIPTKRPHKKTVADRGAA